MNVFWQTFFVSMLPVIELRGGIPFGVNRGLSIWEAYGVALAGNILVCALILALLIPVFNLLKKWKFFAKFVNFFEERFANQAKKVKISYLGLFLFAVLPVPLTGVWTASAVAIFLRLKYFSSFLVISLGAAVCGAIIVAVTLWLGDRAMWVFWGFSAAAVVILTAFIVMAMFKNGVRPSSTTHPG